MAAICADLQRIFQATIDDMKEEAAENVNDAYNEGVRDGQMLTHHSQCIECGVKCGVNLSGLSNLSKFAPLFPPPCCPPGSFEPGAPDPGAPDSFAPI